MKVILHVLAMNTFSGAENVAISLIRGFQQKDSSCRFIYASPDGPIRKVVEDNGIEFAPIKKLCIPELRRLIRTYHPSCIHAHDFTASLLSSVSTWRIPVISHIHNNPPWLKAVNPRTIAYGVSCLRYRRILGVSPSVFDEYVFGKLFRRKMQVIGNPVDPDRIRRMAQQQACDQHFDVVFLGRLTQQKNPLLFLQLIQELCLLRPKTTAVMIGDGELRPEVESFIQEHDLQSSVTLTGFLSNPYSLLSNARVLCLTSSWEGYGLVAIEALALGKPVVAPPVGGIPTIVTGSEGCLCESRDAYVQHLLQLLTDPDEYQHRSAAAVRRASELSNMDTYIALFDELYA